MFLGHSNGGVVSRIAAGNLVSAGSGAVAGVVSVGTPHGGVPLANVGRPLLFAALAVPAVSTITCRVVRTFLCDRSSLLADGVFGVVALLAPLVDAYAPVASETRPSNPLHTFINSRVENFPHIAVVNLTWDRWTAWRMYADSKFCGRPFELYGPCATYSRQYVNSVDKTYRKYIKCAVVGGLLGIVHVTGGWPVAFGCGQAAAGMRLGDAFYKRITVGRSHGDWLVPEWSQRWPGAFNNNQLYVTDAPSHVGETSSVDRTGPQIAIAIQRFGIQPAVP